MAHEYAPEFPPQEADVSFGVPFDGASPDPSSMGLYFIDPTPGAPNSGGDASVLEPVSFSVPHGFYQSPISVGLGSPTPGATIRYTLDGSESTVDHGEIYTGPLAVTRTTILRAGAFKPGRAAPPTVAQTYIFLDDASRQSPQGQAPRAGRRPGATTWSTSGWTPPSWITPSSAARRWRPRSAPSRRSR
ncbi:chitobiase/beta-hexosaminidase C-terminal domain-containing protein [Tautonia plasticadhaerens]|uniref:chitobiase/beta-hexosaminidase C-terminal domain-containing protein n=1 Tax=Tautonia plasticadhaerens TaxID=2527974 RepID=UPI0018D220BA|nr:chitobiase/beta-hexosaminidase C-terminal domain-containing protein [Tautonia plasticadhaerens]